LWYDPLGGDGGGSEDAGTDSRVVGDSALDGPIFDGSSPDVGSPDGMVVADAGMGPVDPHVAVSSSGTIRNVKIVWNGSDGYYVAWSDDRTGTQQVYFQELDLNGLPAGSEVLVSAVSSGTIASLNLANATGQVGVVWARQDTAAVYEFQRFTADGSPSGPVYSTPAWEPSLIGTPVEPQIGSNGSDFALLLRRPAGVDYVLLDSASRVVDDDNVSTTGILVTFSRPVWTGDRFGLSWSENDTGLVTTHDGTAFGSRAVMNVNETESARLTWGHGKLAFVATEYQRLTGWRYYVRFVDQDGNRLAGAGFGDLPAPLAGTLSINLLRPTSAGYGFVWSGSVIPGSPAYLQAVDMNGAPIGEPEALTRLSIYYEGGPGLAFVRLESGAIWFGRR